MAFVYMVRCAGGAIYTGMAQSIGARLRTHLDKTPAAAKFTRAHPIEGLEALFETESERDARRLEARIKALSREKKLALITAPDALGGEDFPLPEDMGRIRAHLGATIEDCLAGKYERENK